MGTCASRLHNNQHDNESQWPGIILAGTTVEDSIAESDVKDKCCNRKMMQFETAGHSGILYYKLYCTVCGTTKPDTTRAFALKDRSRSQTAASTSQEQLPPRLRAGSSDGKESDTKMPPLSVEDLPRRMTPWTSSQSQSPIRQLLRPSPLPSQTTTSPRG